MPISYASIDQLKRKLKRDVLADVNDTYFNEVLERASRYVDDYTNTFFYQSTIVNEIVDCYGFSQNKIFISNYRMFFPAPIIETQPIVIIENGATLNNNEDYYIYSQNAYIDSSTGWTNERKGVSVSIDLGYEVVPEKVVLWTLEIAQVLCGLGVHIVQDEDGGVDGFIKETIQAWVKDEMKKSKRVLM